MKQTGLSMAFTKGTHARRLCVPLTREPFARRRTTRENVGLARAPGLLRPISRMTTSHVDTDVPSRLDRLPWGAWHWRVLIALGITWVLDGLEVTIVGAVGSVLEHDASLKMDPSDVGAAGTAYLAGAIIGALWLGWLADRLGRKRLFVWTVLAYVVACVLTACSWSMASFVVFRFFTGMAIGGEYAAINSAIDELIPARHRGFADLAVNGSYWIGTAVGALGSGPLLNPAYVPAAWGWRLAFGLGAATSLSILLVRRHVPESPRWLLRQGQVDEASRIVSDIEGEWYRRGHELPPHAGAVRVERGRARGFAEVSVMMLTRYRRRAVYCLTLMATQAFFYNAIFFSYSLIMTRFYDVPASRVGALLVPFAIGNFLGPVILGRWFDKARKTLIAGTYGAAGILLAITGVLFLRGNLSAWTLTWAWSVTFFFGSAAASSAYLSASELFPVDIRGKAIALFYAAGTACGGLVAPWLFGRLVETGERREVFTGYLLGAGLMLLGCVVAATLGERAEGKSLEALSLDA